MEVDGFVEVHAPTPEPALTFNEEVEEVYKSLDEYIMSVRNEDRRMALVALLQRERAMVMQLMQKALNSKSFK
jgi:hypothetical protein